MNKGIIRLLLVGALVGTLMGCGSTAEDETQEEIQEAVSNVSDQVEEQYNEISEAYDDLLELEDEYTDQMDELDALAEEVEAEKEELEASDADIEEYKNAAEVELSEGYPEDVVPLFDEGVLILCTEESASGYYLELRIEPDQYSDAVAFYDEFMSDLYPTEFTEEEMTTKTYNGMLGDWYCSVIIMKSNLAETGGIAISVVKYSME